MWRLGWTTCQIETAPRYNVLSLTVNSVGIITSMIKDYVETVDFQNVLLQNSTGYIKAICPEVMSFDVNTTYVNWPRFFDVTTTYVNWPGFVHHALLRPSGSEATSADVNSLQVFSSSIVTRSVYQILIHITQHFWSRLLPGFTQCPRFTVTTLLISKIF